MFQRAIRTSCLYFLIILLSVTTVFLLTDRLSSIQQSAESFGPKAKCISSDENVKSTKSDFSKPMIFIGGMPRSGTTLMRAILDSHPMVRCGEETRVIPRILSMRVAWKKSPVEWTRLVTGGMNETILDAAVGSFIYQILVRHGENVDVFCDKDPFVLKYAAYVSSIFPNSKFLLLIRDGRAVIHSVMTRKVTITGFSMTDHRQNLKLWNKGIETMVNQCNELGRNLCLMVFYEKLVLQPRSVIEEILKFLNLPWVDQVLHHEELIGKRISLSKTEHSSDQVIKPINLEALSKWVGHLPADVRKEIDTLAPMLKKLGYDTKSENPTYGVADEVVLENMEELKKNAVVWNQKAKQYARVVLNQTSVTKPSL